MRRALLSAIIALAAPVAAQNPGHWQPSGDGSSTTWRWSGGGAIFTASGVFDGATVRVETDPSGVGSWATVTGSTLTAPGTRALHIGPGDVRLTIGSSGASTDVTATLAVAGDLDPSEWIAGTGVDPNDVPSDTEVLTYLSSSGLAEWEPAGGGGGSSIEDGDADTIVTTDRTANVVEVDAGGSEVLKARGSGGGDVNYIDLTAAIAGAAPIFAVTGPGADVPLRIATKGAGELELDLSGGAGDLHAQVGSGVFKVTGTTDTWSLFPLNNTVAFGNGVDSINLDFDNANESGIKFNQPANITRVFIGTTSYTGAAGNVVELSAGDVTTLSLSQAKTGASGSGEFSLTAGSQVADFAPPDSVIEAGGALAGAATNLDGGDLVVRGGDPAAGGVRGRVVADGAVLDLPTYTTLPTCAANTTGYAHDDSGALCYCNGTAWASYGGPGTCS